MSKSKIFAELSDNISKETEILKELCSKRNVVNNNRRESTSIRDNAVHDLYEKIMQELGDLKNAVSKSYIYERIQRETKLSIRTISYILNHTQKKEII